MVLLGVVAWAPPTPMCESGDRPGRWWGMKPATAVFISWTDAIMYESYLGSADDPWFTPDRVDWHRGSRHDQVTQIKLAVTNAVRRGKSAIKAIGPQLINWVSNAEMLHEAWDILAAKGDTAPGPNGHRYEDFDQPEIWELLRTIGKAIRNGTYRVGQEWVVKVPKDRTDPSRGTRPISLINIEDRVVQRAIFEVLQLLFDPLFGRNILGFRRGHGRLHALALAEQTAIAEGRYVFVVEDIKDAFTRIPLNRLMDVLAVYVPSANMLQLLRWILDAGKKHGIRQGGPLSPLLLNLFLHDILDRPWQEKMASVPMIRVADDILLICGSLEEANQARTVLESLLGPANMSLKGAAGATIHDLRQGASAKWLGFEIRKRDQTLAVEIAAKAWQRLKEYLVLAHETPDSSLRAGATVNGWIEQMGPCYPFIRCREVYRKLVEVAKEQAFDEIPTCDAVVSRWRRAHQRWCELRDEVRNDPSILDSVWNRRTGDEEPAENAATGGRAQFQDAHPAHENVAVSGADSTLPWE